MRQRLFQRLDAVGLTDDPGVYGQPHYASVLGRGLAIKHLELVDQVLGVLFLGALVLEDDRQIAHLVGVGHRDKRPLLGLNWIRHLVVDPVADVALKGSPSRPALLASWSLARTSKLCAAGRSRSDNAGAQRARGAGLSIGRGMESAGANTPILDE